MADGDGKTGVSSRGALSDKARVEQGFWDKVRRTLGRVPFVEEAVAAYEQAIALRPDYGAAHNNLGTLCREQGQLEQAIDHYEAASRQEPSIEALTNLGVDTVKMVDPGIGHAWLDVSPAEIVDWFQTH